MFTRGDPTQIVDKQKMEVSMKIFIFSDEDRLSTPASLLLLFKLDKINFDEIDYDFN